MRRNATFYANRGRFGGLPTIQGPYSTEWSRKADEIDRDLIAQSRVAEKRRVKGVVARTGSHQRVVGETRVSTFSRFGIPKMRSILTSLKPAAGRELKCDPYQSLAQAEHSQDNGLNRIHPFVSYGRVLMCTPPIFLRSQDSRLERIGFSGTRKYGLATACLRRHNRGLFNG